MALEIIRLVSEVSSSVKRVWDWHVRPGALQRLLPPWEPIEVVRRDEGVEEGRRTTVRLGLGPTGIDWVSEHLAPVPGESFAGFQIAGPFASWRHRHLFSAISGSACEIEDRIDYELPCEPFGAAVAGRYLRERIERGIAYRHRVVSRDLAMHSRAGLDPGRRVGLTGSTGLIGSALTHVLSTGGHIPIALARPTGDLQPAALADLDAVVHLAGEPIAAGQWTAARRRRIRDSRVEGTRRLSELVAGMESPPEVLICASAIGFYGDRGDESLDEQ
ncbi:MAG: NAD-dependent epimerase/dehydratase family protein, partial [Gemmatimonadota bacterium]